MALHLDCPGCGAKFSVDERFAGRQARCKKCGTSIHIPSAGIADPSRNLVSSQVSIGARTPQSAMSAATPLGNRRPDTWIDAITSHVGLAPISAERLTPIRPILPSALADEAPSGPYRVAAAPDLPALDAASGRAAGAITVAYRHQVGNLLKVFRWLNQTAYLISVPFIMVFLFGVITKSHGFTALGATVVILLNATRLVTGLGNLVVIPFRDSPLQGIIFLIPPLSLIYLVQHWPKVKKPVLRVIGPVGTVGIIVLTFAFTPWLRGGDKPESIKEELRDGVKAVKETIREELDIDPKHPSSKETATKSRTRAPINPADLQDPG
jgi:predicted Zn finger-like uncharacterized protein